MQLRLSDRDAAGRAVYRAQLKEQCYENEAIRKRFVLHFFGDSADDEEMRGVSACMTMFRRSVIETVKIRFRSERNISAKIRFSIWISACLQKRR